jgi:hypothetical protein
MVLPAICASSLVKRLSANLRKIRPPRTGIEYSAVFRPKFPL